ncbi:hypothetical protein [Actinoplanes subglobosus]|uniref:DUF2690 domain-containing protein n=1 Tax=Actinoplanes subglobosus TaxID=1547892 RepID=A0ABV8ILY0_9ACTN
MLLRRALVILSTILMGVSALVLPASPAAAAVHCVNFGCDGLKVADTDCKANAYAITGMQVTDSAGTVTGRGDLFYSVTCHAMWGDFTSLADAYSGTLYLEFSPEYGGVNQQRANAAVSGKMNHVTTLLGWQRSVRMCAVTGMPNAFCTPWR